MIFKPFENFEINDFILPLFTIYVAYYYYRYFTRVNPLPGPFPLPLIGTFPYVIWFRLIKKDATMFFKFCYDKYGDIYETNNFVRCIVLCRTEYIEDLSSSKSKLEMRCPDYEGLKELGVVGKGITYNNNFNSWTFNRHFFNQAILSPKFTNEVIDWTNELFNELESYWNRLFLKEEIIKENKNKLDFIQWFSHYKNDMIIKLLTGERSYSMEGYFITLNNKISDHQSTRIKDSAKLFQAIYKFQMSYFIFFVFPSFLRHHVPFFKNIANDILQKLDFINQKLDAIIKRRRQEIEDTPLNESLPHDILTSMIIKNTLRDGNYIETGANRFMSDSEIRVNLLDGIIGGTYKSANMLSFIIYYIAHHPIVKMKMLEEIDNIFQGDTIRPITKDDFYNLKYCEAIVKEVARIFPIMYSNIRYIDEPKEIAGYQWPAGITFLANIKAIHNKDDYWEEPNKFNPDRWMDENFEPKKDSFIMFGTGLRLCPGRNMDYRIAIALFTCDR
ncbi:cytochrome P450 [Rhizophagus irregularis DAOM 181602=DAOM 197198]|nr:cytochrome P450 [Rhizophagus irregularis DAOM 181602=DAOM 197198]